jgi:hypothetical protein
MPYAAVHESDQPACCRPGSYGDSAFSCRAAELGVMGLIKCTVTVIPTDIHEAAENRIAALAGAAIEMRLESPAEIRTVARSFIRVPPYGPTIIEISFRRRAISSDSKRLRDQREFLNQQKLCWVFVSGVEVRTAPRYALSSELSKMVRLTAAFLDDVLHVRTADV